MPVLGTLIVIGAAAFMVAALLIVGRLVPAASENVTTMLSASSTPSSESCMP